MVNLVPSGFGGLDSRDPLEKEDYTLEKISRLKKPKDMEVDGSDDVPGFNKG